MALSRLRQPIISHSIRILTSSTRSISRPASWSGLTGVCDRPLKSKRIDVRFFSSSDFWQRYWYLKVQRMCQLDNQLQ
ncbi:hypothetical protein TSUD_40460 [Trifolium subterraneum]|uniref:Uncharacterized protein n=1 Tax=Trifolium subterraneum TaxID=3900 RepID=A0A2Z6NAV9_TRISU|nr:hypothetical protein TSUD_40460 [Trifolium subterraneum]